jgi:mannose-6-phosphate isomerase-like protein (cupin superfamily)
MRLSGIVEKGWGYEHIWATNDKYCAKFLHFNTGARFSMHFHADKEETWYVLNGSFIVKTINTENAVTNIYELKEGDVWHNDPLQPHQLICLKEGTIIEVSTPDSVEDNYRIYPGDSQNA